MTESGQQSAPPDPEEALRQQLAEKLARDSRRSAILGFLAGTVVIGGLAATFIATLQTKDKLRTQMNDNATLQGTLTKTNEQAAATKEKAETVKSVLSATMEDLQSKGPAVSASATAALNHAFEVNPTATKLLVRVYIHTRAKSQHARAAEIAKALRKAEYVVPGIDIQPYPAGAYSSTQVHYYTNDSQSLSDAQAIQKVVASTGIPVTSVQASPKDKPPARSYGLWLASGLQ